MVSLFYTLTMMIPGLSLSQTRAFRRLPFLKTSAFMILLSNAEMRPAGIITNGMVLLLLG